MFNLSRIYLYSKHMEVPAALIHSCNCAQEVAVPEVLYEEVIEVDERVVLRQDGCQLPGKDSKRIVTGTKRFISFSSTPRMLIT